MSQLTINISPIEFTDSAFTAGVLEFASREQLRKLRDDHKATHVFRRAGNQIVSIQLDGNASSIGTASQRQLSKEQSLVVVLARRRLADYFSSLGRTIRHLAPLQVESNSPTDDQLAIVTRGLTPPPAWLSARIAYDFDVRLFFLEDQEPFPGVAVDLRTVRNVDGSCKELLSRGLNLTGLFAKRITPPPELDKAQASWTLGRIVGIADDQLQLDGSVNGITAWPITDAVLRNDRESFNRALALVYPKDALAVGEKLRIQMANVRTGPEKLRRLSTLVDYLGKQPMALLPNKAFKLGGLLEAGKSRRFPPVRQAPAPRFVFDPAGNKTDSSKPRGLDNFGPYTAQTLTPTQPNVCVICESRLKGEVEQFLHKFFNGVTPGTGKFPPFKKGLIRGYGLEKINPRFFTSDSDKAGDYRAAAQKALEFQAEGDLKWDLAIVQSSEASHDLEGDNNSYLVTKAAFLGQQIPVQEFEAETMRYQAAQLEYTLSNMALATYAKLGGVPWLIKADPTIAHELVVGMGSCLVGAPGSGQQQRLVGITTMFSGDGNYFLSNLSRAVSFDQFKPALLESLRSTFQRAIKQFNWQKGDHVRLIFHSFKPLKDEEATAVKDLMADFGDYSVEYAFLHLVDDHPLLILDRSQGGVFDYETKKTKGAMAPSRGQYLSLSKWESLLVLTGPKEVKKATDGIPSPLLLRLHKDSSFRDLSYLAKQAYAFSDHSWRGFLPVSMPVTISYSQLIARMLGRLNQVPHWNPDSMLGRLGRSRWFL